MSVSQIFSRAVPVVIISSACWLGASAQSGSGNENSARVSSADASGQTRVAPADRAFVMKAAQGGLAEVQLGQLATQKASSDEVKQFGQRMVDDHSKANDQLKQLATQKGIAIPDQLSSKDAATKARLEKLSGEQFDRAYMHDMVTDHTKDVSEFRTESKTAKDADVKNFASQTLPTLQEHLKQAQKVAPKTSQMKKKQTEATGGNQ
jgi:putative membrane protein